MKAKTRALAGLVLAVIGVSTAAVLRTSEVRAKRPTETRQRTEAVVIAARDLAPGTTVSQADVKIAQWPANLMPSSPARSVDEVVGRGVVAPIYQGEPVMAGRLGANGAGAGLPVLLAAGERALSVRVDDVIGVAGFIQPGSHVDVLVSAREGGEPSANVVLQDVRVLATGQHLQPDTIRSEQAAAVITLAVTPEQAELLTLAANEGRIQLALRHPLDSAPAKTTGASMAQLMRNAKPVVIAPRAGAPKAPRRPSFGIEVYNGAKQTVTTFRDTVK
ncbi:MAG TPA: Flp pilus assembly protein CpaB [Longimicrobiales bacterium]|nr:Flp pilus assembly protein CpaB [Longimicrobiales bacterium]